MTVPYLKITGWGDAIRSMYMSNKNYSYDIERKIASAEYYDALEDTPRSFHSIGRHDDHKERSLEWFEKEKSKVIRIGSKHITLLRFVDISWVCEGLHRGAQDDFDSHAERFDNRIVRMSTRTTKDGKIAETSDWYKDQILTFDDLESLFNLPEEIDTKGKTFVKTPFGYIDKSAIGTADERDVRRGLVPLSVSSTFIVKCQLTEFCHVFRERNRDGNAAPELKDMIETVASRINQKEPLLDREFFLNNCLQ